MRGRRPDPPLLLALLRAAADRSSSVPEAKDPAEVRWAVETDLGPLLAHLLGDRLARLPAPLAARVRGAELAARLTAAEQLDAMAALLDRCAGLAEPPTLLKGVSVCEDLYPAPHLRPMGDLDVLVDEPAIPEIEAALLALGYRRQSSKPPAYYERHHHTTPFVHAASGVCVEVHRDLFPATLTMLAADPVFSRPRVAAERRPSTFRGRAVYRLSPELQLVYTAAHWALELHPAGGLVAVLDVVYLLAGKPGLDWPKVRGWLAGSRTTAAVHLVLSYVARHGLAPVPADVLKAFRTDPYALGRAALALLHGILDRHLVSARRPGRLRARNADVTWRTLLGQGKSPGGLLALPVRLLPRIRGRWRHR